MMGNIDISRYINTHKHTRIYKKSRRTTTSSNESEKRKTKIKIKKKPIAAAAQL